MCIPAPIVVINVGTEWTLNRNQADLLRKIEKVLVPKGDTSSFTIKIIKIVRKFAESANSRCFLSLSNFFLVSLVLYILAGALS
jgi:hypothetical protein